MSDSRTQAITDALHKCGKELSRDSRRAGPLRELQGRFKELQYEESDEDLRLLEYFLCVFVDDFFYNLAGDIPYSNEFNQIQHDAIEQIGTTMIRMAEKIEAEEDHAICEGCKELVTIYVARLRDARILG